jgi:hypothetical protein
MTFQRGHVEKLAISRLVRHIGQFKSDKYLLTSLVDKFGIVLCVKHKTQLIQR